MSNNGSGDRGTEHLSDLDDGAGCTEIWEKLSDHRDARGKAAGRNVQTGGNAK